MSEATPYSTLLSRIEAGSGRASLEVPDDWLQGRTLFGGLQAAIALRAMRTLVPDAPLRSLQSTFIAPVAGGRVEARARVLRSGRNATHVEARIVDGEETLALVVGVFGLARESLVKIVAEQPAVEASRPIEMQYVPGAMPAFTQHFKARWVKGGPPFTGATARDNVIDLGMRDPGPMSEYHVVAMADFIPPIALSFLTERAHAASLSWMLELLVDDVSALSPDGWRLDAHVVAGHDGYTHQSLELWGPDGMLAALGRQTMVVFA
ncbi:MAG TPA: thioesterase family protein [Usitatibacter sp.]|nr:thioesterase family protein [Usitatibacter sp.]